MRFEIEHIVSDIEAEIYVFEARGDSFQYAGISYSRRNDTEDVWGHLWSEHFARAKEKEMKEFEDYDDDYYNFCPMIEERISAIKDKYNPCIQKTKSGRSYYNAQYGGKLPAPKLNHFEIKDRILNKIAAFSIKTV